MFDSLFPNSRVITPSGQPIWGTIAPGSVRGGRYRGKLRFRYILSNMCHQTRFNPGARTCTTLGKGMKLTPGEVRAWARWGWVMNELTPRGHLRPLGGRENPRRARPESRSPRRCAHARGAPYSPRAAPSILTKGEPTGTRAQVPSRSCTCAKALTETHPGVRMADGDWKSH